MRQWFFVCLVVLCFGCDDIIEVEDISNRTVTVLAPSDNATLSVSNVSFTWNAVEDAEHYRLQVAEPSFEAANQIVLDTIISTTSFTQLLNSGDYQWRVRAENSGYETAYTTQSFTVLESEPVDISNEDVVLLAPSNASVFNTSDTINFVWESVLGADNYVIQIATPDFNNAVDIIEDDTTTQTNFTVSNLTAQSYEWRVKAVNEGFETDYTTQSFTVED